MRFAPGLIIQGEISLFLFILFALCLLFTEGKIWASHILESCIFTEGNNPDFLSSKDISFLNFLISPNKIFKHVISQLILMYFMGINFFKY